MEAPTPPVEATIALPQPLPPAVIEPAPATLQVVVADYVPTISAVPEVAAPLPPPLSAQEALVAAVEPLSAPIEPVVLVPASDIALIAEPVVPAIVTRASDSAAPVDAVMSVIVPDVGEKRAADMISHVESAAVEEASSSSSSSSSDSESDAPRPGKVDDDLEEDEVFKGPPRTQNEVVELPPEEPLAVLRVAVQDLSSLGIVRSEVEGQLVIEASPGARLVDESTLVGLADGTVIGKVVEVFGPVSKPYYAVRLPAGATLPVGGTLMFSVASHAKYISDWRALVVRGSDASNEWDEEIGENQQEYSDDEAEAAAAAARKHKPKAQRTEGGYATYTPMARPQQHRPPPPYAQSPQSIQPPHHAHPTPQHHSSPMMQPSLPPQISQQHQQMQYIPPHVPAQPPSLLPTLQQPYMHMHMQQTPMYGAPQPQPPQPQPHFTPLPPPFQWAKPPAFDLFAAPPPLPSLPMAGGRGRGRGRGAG